MSAMQAVPLSPRQPSCELGEMWLETPLGSLPVSRAAPAPWHRLGRGRPAPLQPHRAESLRSGSLSGAIREHNVDGRAEGARSHAAGGAGAAGGGAGGEDWLPSTSQRRCCRCPGSYEAVGPLRKGWQAAMRGPVCQDTLCPTSARCGSHAARRPGHRWLLFPVQNFSPLQDVAHRVLFPSRTPAVAPAGNGAAGAPSCWERLGSGHPGSGAEGLCTGRPYLWRLKRQFRRAFALLGLQPPLAQLAGWARGCSSSLAPKPQGCWGWGRMGMGQDGQGFSQAAGLLPC